MSRAGVNAACGCRTGMGETVVITGGRRALGVRLMTNPKCWTFRPAPRLRWPFRVNRQIRLRGDNQS